MRNSNNKPIWTLSRELSDADNQVFVHSFPIIKDKITKKPIIIGEFVYNKTDNTLYTKVYDACNDTTYAPYYDRRYGNYKPILDKCADTIAEEMKKVGLKYVNDNYK